MAELEIIMECTDMAKLKEYGFIHAWSFYLNEPCYLTANGTVQIRENGRMALVPEAPIQCYLRDKKIFEWMRRDGMFVEVQRA
ncbi:MAG: hypothetical protein HUJ60_04860 [Bacilli bacterium]|mgnify:FL=1|nr:hypothetical protein [Bacilli bacterium]